jgi:pSer/pThr/pTyr-binding forkhead associated (FHA) protein/outer membrane protein assembly factor BamD (BamD/ComL family)
VSEESSFKLIIEDDEGRRSVVPVDLGEVSIGRLEGNTIRLNERNVSRRHARLFRDNGAVVAEDLDSYNGVFVNGDRIKGRHEVHDGDLLKIGDFQLELRGEGLQRRSEETTQRTLIPGMETTQPEIRMEATQPAASLPQPPGSQTQPVLEDSPQQRHEPTAIIRMGHLADVEAQRRGSRAIAGQRAKLVCVSTQFAGQEFEIDKTEVVIGRTDENDIAIDHRSVSRHHAKVTATGRSYKIIDLKSANGTLVNGEEYAQADLKNGDMVELGHVKFRFVPPGEDYAFTTEESAAIQARDSQLGPNGGQTPSLQDTIASLGLFDTLKSNPMLVMAIVGLAMLILVMLVWMIASRQGGTTSVAPAEAPAQPTAVPAPVGVAPAQPAGSDADGLVARATVAASQRQWTQARDLAHAALVLQPGHVHAQTIADRAEKEAEAQKHYDAAVAYINDSKWVDAWNHLQQIESPSAYFFESRGLMDQVRAALITERVAEADRALREEDWETALAQADEIASLEAKRPDVERIRAAAEEGKQKRATASTAAAPRPRPKPRPKPVGKTKPASKTKPSSSSSPSPLAAPSQDEASAAYKAGATALKSGQLQKAVDQLSRCIKIDKRYALCHRAMGIAYARMRNGPKAYRYYKQYIKLAPNADDAAQVRQYLQQYEQNQ